MAGEKILVLGGTGPAGICLLRELVARKHATVAFCRNPAKIPEDLVASGQLEIIKGELTDLEALSTAISKSHTIVSLLGPTGLRLAGPTIYADFYRSAFPLMREHGVRRIFAMGTVSIYQPDDRPSILRSLVVLLLSLFASQIYRNVVNIGKLFEHGDAEEAVTRDIDWTVYRIAGIPGGSDAASWARDREDGESYVGPVSGKGWSMYQKRGALARWLVDAAESGAPEWIGKMPAVSRLAGSKAKTS